MDKRVPLCVLLGVKGLNGLSPPPSPSILQALSKPLQCIQPCIPGDSLMATPEIRVCNRNRFIVFSMHGAVLGTSHLPPPTPTSDWVMELPDIRRAIHHLVKDSNPDVRHFVSFLPPILRNDLCQEEKASAECCGSLSLVRVTSFWPLLLVVYLWSQSTYLPEVKDDVSLTKPATCAKPLSYPRFVKGSRGDRLIGQGRFIAPQAEHCC